MKEPGHLSRWRGGPQWRAAPMTRFWLNVRIGDPDECWPWTRYTGGDGYGSTRFAGKSEWAHRVAWELATCRSADGMFVCHTCDNPPCCNPRHLVLGTREDNRQDAARKGRLIKWICSRGHDKRQPPGYFMLAHGRATQCRLCYEINMRNSVARRTARRLALEYELRHGIGKRMPKKKRRTR